MIVLYGTGELVVLDRRISSNSNLQMIKDRVLLHDNSWFSWSV